MKYPLVGGMEMSLLLQAAAAGGVDSIGSENPIAIGAPKKKKMASWSRVNRRDQMFRFNSSTTVWISKLILYVMIQSND